MNFPTEDSDISKMSRRVCLATIAFTMTGFAACIKSGNNDESDIGGGDKDDTDNTDNEVSTSPECVPREPRPADGEPIEITVTEPDSDDLEWECKREAYGAAVSAFGDRLGVEEIHKNRHIGGNVFSTELELIIDDTGRRQCPDIDFEEAVEHTPSEVIVNFESDPEFECHREVTVSQVVEVDE